MGKRRRGARRLALTGVLSVVAVALWVPGAASADPVASTGGVSALTSNSAQLNGTVDATSPFSTFFFEYGTTTAYGQATPVTPVGAGPTNVSAPVSGLLPDATYHYQIVVEQGLYSPTSLGQDATFTTPASPSTVATTGQATSITATTAELNGVTNTNTPGSSWFFEYGRSNVYGRRTATSSALQGVVVVSAKLTGLAPLTSYHFRLVVDQGSSSPENDGIDQSFTTIGADGTTSLRKRHLKVRHGVVAMRLQCQGLSGAPCDGKISVTKRARVRKQVQTVRCGMGTFVASAGHSHTVRAKVGRRCESLLQSAQHHRLGATLNATFSTHQTPLRIAVTLVGT